MMDSKEWKPKYSLGRTSAIDSTNCFFSGENCCCCCCCWTYGTEKEHFPCYRLAFSLSVPFLQAGSPYGTAAHYQETLNLNELLYKSNIMKATIFLHLHVHADLFFSLLLLSYTSRNDWKISWFGMGKLQLKIQSNVFTWTFTLI